MQCSAIQQNGRNHPWQMPRQMLLIMRLMSLLMLAFCMQVTARTNGQTISLSVKNATLTEILKQIQLKTGYNIIAEQSLLNNTNKISFTVQNTSVQEVLKLSLKDLPIEFVIENRTIVFKRIVLKPVEDAAATITEVPAVAMFTGKVITAEGIPIAKVSVYNNTSRKGSTTADDGTFQIEANVGDQLIFTHISFKHKQLQVTSKNNIFVEMEPVEKNMDEYVANGYQTIRKSNMAGAMSKVKAEDLIINSTTTVEQMLQGKLAGVEVINRSGMIGTRQTVRVRGVSTLFGNQEPVWVVDGIIQEDPLPFQAKELNRFNQEPSNSELLKNFIGSTISWLNPYDIEEVVALKDAASTAIYGVKAANGVIIITTKRGKTGSAPVINYNGGFSTESKLTYNRMNLMNSKERVDVSREIYQRGLISSASLDNVGYQGLLQQYLAEKISGDEFTAGVKQLEVNNTDWFDILFQRPLSTSHNISVSGGSSNNSYYGSFGYNSKQGQAIGNSQTSYQGSINFNSNVNNRLTISAKIAGDYTKTKGFYSVEPYTYAAQTTRVIPAYKQDGSLSYYQRGGYRYNVLNELGNTGNVNYKTSLNANINLRYRIGNGFTLESVFGTNLSNVHGESYASERTHRIASQKRLYEYGQYGPTTSQYKMSQLPIGGELAIMANRNFNYTWRNSVNYAKNIKGLHTISSTVGYEIRSNSYNGNTQNLFGYMPDRGKSIISPPATIQNAVGGLIANPLYSINTSPMTIVDTRANYVSYYATGNYTYDNRYSANLSIRGDASNRFGQDTRSRFKPIWAIGGRWNVANESFFNRKSWMNELSLRASYGYQGNVAENYGPDLIARIPNGEDGINTLTGEPILRIGSLPYTNLRWEKTQTINLGLDLSMFKGKVGLVVDYYNKRSKDLIVLKDVAYENGVLQMPMNAGTLYNSGIDISVNLFAIRTTDFSWSVGFNAGKNFNKITNRQQQNPTWNTARSGEYHVKGYAVSSFWVFDYTGPDVTTGVPAFNIPNTTQDPSGKYDAVAFMKYGGKLNADFNGGFNSSIRYKGFTLSSNAYLSLGAHKILAPLFTPDIVNSTPNEYNNLSKDLVNRWRKPGDHILTDIPGLPFWRVPTVEIPSGSIAFGNQLQTGFESPYLLYNFSDARVVNASYLRINNINVSYTLPQLWAKKIASKSLSIAYSMGNVHTFVSKDYKGIDPEVASGSQPLSRTHSFNISVAF